MPSRSPKAPGPSWRSGSPPVCTRSTSSRASSVSICCARFPARRATSCTRSGRPRSTTRRGRRAARPRRRTRASGPSPCPPGRTSWSSRSSSVRSRVSDLARAAELLDGAGALLICAGAGMGVDSGLPDFRGGEGFWRAYPPYARLGLRFEELADPRHFTEDPELAWGFYGHRLSLYRQTVPHEGFRLLRSFGSRLSGGVRVFTSNVDGQFQKAGFEQVAEAHGSIHHLQCLDGCAAGIWPAEMAVVVDEETMRAVPPLPSCPRCGGL